MKKVIVHILKEKSIYEDKFIGDLDVMEDFSKKYWIHNLYFYESNKEPPILLNTSFAEVRNYLNEEELEEKIKLINKNNEIICISAPYDNSISLANKLRKLIWHKLSDYPEMFNDKSLQRKLLYENDLDISVNYVKFKIKELTFDEVVKIVGLPFVIKPLNWSSSKWVAKIKTEKNFLKYVENYEIFRNKMLENWLSYSDEIIAEEYISWEFYSIDYFVDKSWNITISKPVSVKLWTDIWINDFSNLIRVVSQDTEKEYDEKKLMEFIERNVKATWIRNTFIHHEFKITKKWVYKTIELNWRIWWRRLFIYYLAYWVNLFSFLFEKPIFNLISNIAVIRLYACKRWIFKSVNEKYLEKIKKFSSFKNLAIEKEISSWESIGLAKDWFWYVGVLQFKNKDLKEFNKDVKFIEENYCELLDIEENKKD